MGALPKRLRTVPMTEHRDNMREDYAGVAHEPLLVTQRGKPVGVIVSPEAYDLLVELQDLRETRSALRAGEEAASRGEVADAQGMGARILERVDTK